VSPRGELTATDWLRQGRSLGAIGRASGWWIGDWVRYGNARYGERYGLAARVTGYDVQTLMNLAYVAGRFDRSRRRESLSYSNHAELASLPPEDQELSLDRAQAGALSVRSLRCELRQVQRRVTVRTARSNDDTELGSAPAAAEIAEVRHRVPRRQATASGVAGCVDAVGGLSAANGGPAGEIEAAARMVCPRCGHPFDVETDGNGSAANTGAQRRRG
jgi:hypothetical protein